MQLKNLFRDLMMIGSILALSACAAPGHKRSGSRGALATLMMLQIMALRHPG